MRAPNLVRRSAPQCNRGARTDSNELARDRVSPIAGQFRIRYLRHRAPDGFAWAFTVQALFRDAWIRSALVSEAAASAMVAYLRGSDIGLVNHVDGVGYRGHVSRVQSDRRLDRAP